MAVRKGYTNMRGGLVMVLRSTNMRRTEILFDGNNDNDNNEEEEEHEKKMDECECVAMFFESLRHWQSRALWTERG